MKEQDPTKKTAWQKIKQATAGAMRFFASPFIAAYTAVKAYGKTEHTHQSKRPDAIKGKSARTDETKGKGTPKEPELDRDDVMFDTFGDKLHRYTTLYDDKSGEKFLDLSGNPHRKESKTNQRLEPSVGKFINTVEVQEGNTQSASNRPSIPNQQRKKELREAPPGKGR